MESRAKKRITDVAFRKFLNAGDSATIQKPQRVPDPY